MQVVFLGSPEFALPSLEKLKKSSDISLPLVVTQPPRKKGRGQQIYPTAVGRYARAEKLELLEIKDINSRSAIKKIANLNPDFLVVVAFGQILKPEVLKLPQKAPINLHASLLPKYRGASPINQAIIAGDEYSGVTTMLMEEGLDTGDILLQEKVKIDLDDTAGSLHDKLAAQGADLLLKTLLDFSQGKIEPRSQSEDKASYSPRLTKKDGEINFTNSASKIHNFIRGNNPWPGAYTHFRDKKLLVWKSALTEVTCEGKPGEIIKAKATEGLFIATQDMALQLKVVQLPGKNKMSARDFICGYQPKVGEQLG